MIQGSMNGKDAGNSPEPFDDRLLNDRPLCEQSRLRGSGIIIAILAIAVLLAVAFFYISSERREDARTNAAINAAEAVDNAARNVGDATQKAAEKLRSGK
ncbi:MAG TPA: hypothetical protein VF509_09055 [Sphingobium sp.]